MKPDERRDSYNLYGEKDSQTSSKKMEGIGSDDFPTNRTSLSEPSFSIFSPSRKMKSDERRDSYNLHQEKDGQTSSTKMEGISSDDFSTNRTSLSEPSLSIFSPRKLERLNSDKSNSFPSKLEGNNAAVKRDSILKKFSDRWSDERRDSSDSYELYKENDNGVMDTSNVFSRERIQSASPKVEGNTTSKPSFWKNLADRWSDEKREINGTELYQDLNVKGGTDKTGQHSRFWKSVQSPNSSGAISAL